MAALSEDELRQMTEAMGLGLDRERIHTLLPEVQRLRDAAARLRELPLGPEDPWWRREA